MEESFWLNGDFSVLFTNPKLIPSSKFSLGENLNIYSRLLFLSTGFLLISGWEHTALFFLAGMILILAVAYIKGGNKQNFTITPTYPSTDFTNITVSPSYSEEWQVNPAGIDYTDNVVGDPQYEFEEPVNPQEKPYGQYLTNTNFLPTDDAYINQIGTKNGAITYMNSAFLRHDLGFRDNMTRISKLKLKNRFRHNTNDTFSPYSGN